jgi:hypothetical protein
MLRRRRIPQMSFTARSTLEKSVTADQTSSRPPTRPALAAWALSMNRSRYGSMVVRAPTARFSKRNSWTRSEIFSIPVKAWTTENATTSAGTSAKSEM